jgi:hypothetical protein
MRLVDHFAKFATIVTELQTPSSYKLIEAAKV